MTPSPWKVIYDQDCSLCSRFADVVRRFGGEDITAISIERYSRYHDEIPRAELEAQLHLFGPEGEVFRGADAARQILLIAPVLRPFRWLLRMRPAGTVVSAAYRRASRIRARRCRSCR